MTAPGGVPERLTVAEIRTRRGRWTADQLRQLPATVDLETAASVLAMGLTKARELARIGEFPVRVIHHGDRYVIPARALLVLLDVEAERPAG
jgi:hypothetical protein